MEIDGTLVSSLGANQCVEMLGHGDQWLSKHTTPPHTASEIRFQLVSQYSLVSKNKTREAPPSASRVHKSPSSSQITPKDKEVLEEYKAAKQALDEHHQSELAALEIKLKQATISKSLLQKSIAKATT